MGDEAVAARRMGKHGTVRYGWLHWGRGFRRHGLEHIQSGTLFFSKNNKEVEGEEGVMLETEATSQ